MNNEIANLETALRALERTINKLATQYAGRGIEADDLRQEAYKEAIRAYHNYDPARARWRTYAEHRVRGAMLDYIRQQRRHRQTVTLEPEMQGTRVEDLILCRPEGPKDLRITIRLSGDIVDAIDAQTREVRGMDRRGARSSFARMAISHFLHNHTES